MECSRRTKLYLFLSLLSFLGWSASAQYTEQIGLTLLQATTTNINGTGITVGQPEADNVQNAEPSQFEVNPASISQRTGLITYISSNGVSSTFTNTVGLESSHADGVAGGFYGMPDGLATNVAHVYNYDADYYIDHLLVNNLDPYNESVVNQSYTFGVQPTNVQEEYDTSYDNYEETHHTLFISAVGPNSDNTQPPALPGTAYNCISIGAYDNNGYHNYTGPTLDNGRCKPDITGIAGEASYSCNQVSGAATVLKQAALRGDGGTDTNSAFDNRTIKALLLNGAVKPLGWTNSPLFPLDARYGAGVVNVYNSYRILAGGKHGSIISNQVPSGGVHPPITATGTEPVLNGWDFDTNNSNINPARDAIYHYYFNVSNNLVGVKFIATATLVWNRHANTSGINNLNLFLYDCANSNLVACCTSLVDNVEHIYVTNLNQGRYDLQVWKLGTNGIVGAAEPYALAWQFFYDRLYLAQSGGNSALTWPMYPAGFLVEATTNLAFPAWTPIDLSSLVFTNNTNSLTLTTTASPQFFRLRSPNL